MPRYRVKIGGLIGVPTYFIDSHLGDEQFDIINLLNRYPAVANQFSNPEGTYATSVGGKRQYARVVIRRKTR